MSTMERIPWVSSSKSLSRQNTRNPNAELRLVCLEPPRYQWS